VLQAVLDTYERCKGSDGGEVVVNATTDGIVHEHLQRIGFVRAPAPDGAPSPGVSMMTMKLAHHEQLEAFEVTKSRARSEYHARRAQQHEADFIGQLASLFDMRHIVHNEDDPGETLFFPEEEEEEAHRGAAPFPLEQAKASLAAFVQRYHKVIDHTPHAVVLYPLSHLHITDLHDTGVGHDAVHEGIATSAGGAGGAGIRPAMDARHQRVHRERRTAVLR
jgi:hypothetical protein